MRRTLLKALYLKDGSPSDALRAALETLRCSTLDELQAKVKHGKVTLLDVLRLRLGGTVYRRGIVARVLFPAKRRKALRAARVSGLPRAPRRIALPPEPDHERAHLALFTD